MMDKNIDLHIHTSWSDGTYTPETCVEVAKNASVDVISITDHNTFEGIEEAIYFGDIAGIKVVPGIEFNVNYAFNLHFLAYFNGYDFLPLQSYFYNLRSESAHKTTQKSLEMLNNSGFKYDQRALTKLLSSRHTGIYGVFYGLCEQGLFESPYEVEKELFAKGKPCNFNNMFTLTEVFSIIKSCGGTIILAHPTVYGLDKQIFENMVLPELIDAGLEGLEVYHSQMTEEDSEYLLSLCEKHGLIYSGGSDFHGANRPGTEIGYIAPGKRVPPDALNKRFYNDLFGDKE